MNLPLYCNWLFVLLPAAGHTQAFYQVQHPVYMTGGAYSSHFTDAFSFTANQAVLANAAQCRLAILSERRFMLKELDLYSVAFSTPFASGGLGFRLDYSGFADYNESDIGMAYGKKLGNKAAIGIEFNYASIHIAGYGNAGTMSGEAAILIHPVEKIQIGIHFANGGRRAAVYTMGFGYEASEQVFISMEIIKQVSEPLNLRACIDYVADKQFFASLGMETGDTAPYARAGWQWKQIRVSLGAAFHPKLGCTPLFAIMMEGKKKQA